MFSKLIYRLWRYYKLVKDPYTLDIHATEHCNLNCMSCVHYSPLAEPSFIDLKKLETTMNKMKSCHAQRLFREVHVLGGEPLLHPDITSVLQIIRTCFTMKHTQVKLLTNGLLLNKMPNSFWEVCKKYDIEINITIYSIPVDYTQCVNLCKNHGVRVDIYGDHAEVPFGQYRLNPGLEGAKGMRKKYYDCSSHNWMQLDGDRLYLCPQSAYVRHLNKAMGFNFKHRKGDYLQIDKLNRLSFWIFRFKPKPFCEYCVMPYPLIKWQMSKRKVEEWVVEP